MKRLFCLSLVLILFHLPQMAQSQSHPSLHGVNAGMSAPDFKAALSKRGFSCEGSVLPEGSTVCFEPFSAGNAMQAFMEIAPRLDPIIDPAFKRGRMISDQEADAALEFLEASPKALKTLKYIVRIQSKEHVSIFYSCAVFSSCDHEIEKILEALMAQTQMNETAITTLEPTLISDLLIETQKEFEITGPKFQTIRNLARLMPTQTPCLYGGNQSDEICIYNGSLLVQLPQEVMDPSLLTKSKSAVRLSMGVPIDVGMLVLKSESSRGGELNFK